MSQGLSRQTLKQFGLSGATSNFAQFGSQAASAPIKSKSIPTIQQLTAWLDGWQDAVALGQAPYLEDMNGLLYVYGYQMCYQFQEGVPEWDSGTTYNKGSVVKAVYSGGATTWAFFVSLADANTNNALPSAPASNGNWEFMYQATTGSGLIIPGTTTNDQAPATAVGEYAESVVGNTSITTNNTWQNLTTIGPLAPGDWEISALIGFGLNTATGLTSCAGAVSTFSGNTTTDQVAGQNQAAQNVPTSNTDTSVAIPKWRIRATGSNTYYLKALCKFSGGNPNAYGGVFARRPR